MLLHGVAQFQYIPGPHVFQYEDQGDAAGRDKTVGFLLNAAKVIQGRAIENSFTPMNLEPVEGEILRARLEGDPPLGLVLHCLRGLQPDGRVDEGLAFLGMDLLAGQQVRDVAGLFRFEIQPKRAGHNPIRRGPDMNALFGGNQGITLRLRDAFGEHGMVIARKGA